jgi:hypothetical protein
MGNFKDFVNRETINGDRLEINITSNRENGIPVSTVMKHRWKENGRWHYDSDMDSGEQGGAKQLPVFVKILLDKFGHNTEVI